MGKLDNVITRLESKSYGKYLGIPGLFVRGMDNYECLLRDVIKELESAT